LRYYRLDEKNMKNLIIILIILALVVGAYRFVSSRKKGTEAPIEITETEPTVTPTTEEITSAPESQNQTGQDLPSAGGSTEEKLTPAPEELEKIIKEFEKED